MYVQTPFHWIRDELMMEIRVLRLFDSEINVIDEVDYIIFVIFL